MFDISRIRRTVANVHALGMHAQNTGAYSNFASLRNTVRNDMAMAMMKMNMKMKTKNKMMISKKS